MLRYVCFAPSVKAPAGCVAAAVALFQPCSASLHCGCSHLRHDLMAPAVVRFKLRPTPCHCCQSGPAGPPGCGLDHPDRMCRACRGEVSPCKVATHLSVASRILGILDFLWGPWHEEACLECRVHTTPAPTSLWASSSRPSSDETHLAIGNFRGPLLSLSIRYKFDGFDRLL